MHDISRRYFLKTIAVGLLGLGIDAAITPALYTWYVEQTRSVELPQLAELPTATILSGVSPDNNDMNAAQRFNDLLGGHRVQLVNFFVNSTGTWGKTLEQMKLAMASRIVPMNSWYPTDIHSSINRYTDAKKYDKEIREGAQQLRDLHSLVLVRPLYEMNGMWWGWHKHNTPKEAIDFWRFVYEIYQEVGATNVKFVFSPNVTMPGVEPIQLFYPGSEYVDFLSLDAYDWYTDDILKLEHYFYNFSPNVVMGPDLCTLHHLAPGKPFLLGEIGSARDIGKATWLRDAITYVITHMPHTCGVVPYQRDNWKWASISEVVKMYNLLLNESCFYLPGKGVTPQEVLMRAMV